MKNYLCINGKKTELTEEQLKQLGFKKPLLEIDGKIAKVGDYEFIVLSNDGEQVELLLKDSLGFFRFGDNNDFKTSSLRKELDKFAKEIAELVGEENILLHTVDLTTLDGLKEYGTTKTKMSLLTVTQYRKFAEILDEFKIDKWWWLATAWSTPKRGWKVSVSCVSPDGCVRNFNSYSNDRGVRPFCILKSNIF